MEKQITSVLNFFALADFLFEEEDPTLMKITARSMETLCSMPKNRASLMVTASWKLARK